MGQDGSARPRPRRAARASSYELLDAGDGRRLERFGPLVLDRPAPAATSPRREPVRWRLADLRFDQDRGWSRSRSGDATNAATNDVIQLAQPWSIEIEGLTTELRPTSSGGLGLYPEHRANIPWLSAQVRAAVESSGGASVLNLFAHTGLATLVAARAGAAVAHVDAAPGSVAWARRNAELSGQRDRPIRWLVDDALAFTEREARRGHRYAGLVIDPPSTGHARAGRWTIRADLPRLLDACAAVAAPGAFVLLTAHSTGLDGQGLLAALRTAFPRGHDRAEVERLTLTAASGAALDLGWAVRLAAASGGPRARNAAP